MGEGLGVPQWQGRVSAVVFAGTVLLHSARERKVSQHPVWAWRTLLGGRTYHVLWTCLPVVWWQRVHVSFSVLAWSVVLCMLCCPAFTCVLCCFCLPLPRLTLLVPANGWSSAPCLGMGLCPVWAGQACSGRPLVFHVSGPVWVTAVLVAAARVTSIYLSIYLSALRLGLLCCACFVVLPLPVCCAVLPAFASSYSTCFLLTVGPLLLALAWGCVVCGLARLVLVGL
jgi:hypothetical protein